MNNIIQIIPAPENMYAQYENEGEAFELKIVCLALVEDARGRRVEPMINTGTQIVEATAPNFKELVFENRLEIEAAAKPQKN